MHSSLSPSTTKLEYNRKMDNEEIGNEIGDLESRVSNLEYEIKTKTTFWGVIWGVLCLIGSYAILNWLWKLIFG